MIFVSRIPFLKNLAAKTTGNLAGILLMCISTVVASLMFAFIRIASEELHAFSIIFFRNLFGVFFLLTWQIRRLPSLVKVKNPKLHLLRATLNIMAMTLFFSGVIITPLAEVTALGFTAPLFASLLAVFVLRERFHLHRLMVILFGFVGAFVILRPGFTEIHAGELMVLSSACIWALAMMVIKVLSRTESSAAITTYSNLIMTPLSLVLASFVWKWPSGTELLLLALIAFLGTIGQVSLAQSFKLADASAVLPLDFLKLIWGTLLGYFLFLEIPDQWTWLGGIIIFSSTTYLALRETLRRRKT